jgi:hypothetical protein
MLEIAEMLLQINEVQEGQDLKCSCKECYWNLWSPNHKNYNNEKSMLCVSESLTDFKMTPNSEECKGFWSYKEACGHKKEEIK